MYRVIVTDRNNMSTVVFSGQMSADAHDAYWQSVDIARAFKNIIRVALTELDAEVITWTERTERGSAEFSAHADAAYRQDYRAPVRPMSIYSLPIAGWALSQ